MRERATIFVIGNKCINVKLLNFQRICKKISGRMHRKVCNEFSIEFEFPIRKRIYSHFVHTYTNRRCYVWPQIELIRIILMPQMRLQQQQIKKIWQATRS